MSFDTIIHYLAYPQEIEWLGVALTFLLFFAILFFALSRTKTFKRNASIAVAFILSSMVIVFHLTDKYPPCYDVVVLVQNAMPQFGLMMIAAVSCMMFLALIGIRKGSSPFFFGLVSIASIAFLVYTFIAAKSGYYRQMCPAPPQFFTLIGELSSAGWLAFAIVVVVFLLLVRYMMRKSK